MNLKKLINFIIIVWCNVFYIMTIIKIEKNRRFQRSKNVWNVFQKKSSIRVMQKKKVI